MAYGLEARSPLLYHEATEWGARIPEDVKIRGGETRALFIAGDGALSAVGTAPPLEEGVSARLSPAGLAPS